MKGIFYTIWHCALQYKLGESFSSRVAIAQRLARHWAFIRSGEMSLCIFFFSFYTSFRHLLKMYLSWPIRFLSFALPILSPSPDEFGGGSEGAAVWVLWHWSGSTYHHDIQVLTTYTSILNLISDCSVLWSCNHVETCINKVLIICLFRQIHVYLRATVDTCLPAE